MAQDGGYMPLEMASDNAAITRELLAAGSDVAQERPWDWERWKVQNNKSKVDQSDELVITHNRVRLGEWFAYAGLGFPVLACYYTTNGIPGIKATPDYHNAL